MITISTITVHERAANTINSTTLGPRLAVELEPNVCVWQIKGITEIITILTGTLFGAKKNYF